MKLALGVGFQTNFPAIGKIGFEKVIQSACQLRRVKSEIQFEVKPQ